MGFTPTFLGLSAATRNSIRFARAVCKVKQFPFRGVLTVLAVAALWLSSGPFARGQSTFGSIVGSVVDTSNAMVPGTTVTITNEETGITRARSFPWRINSTALSRIPAPKGAGRGGLPWTSKVSPIM